MTCSTPCLNHEYGQGRGCECDTNATRASFAIAPLQQKDGGTAFHHGIAFPITREEDDQPLVTPESAADPLPNLAEALVGFILLALLAISAFALPALISHT